MTSHVCALLSLYNTTDLIWWMSLLVIGDSVGNEFIPVNSTYLASVLSPYHICVYHLIWIGLVIPVRYSLLLSNKVGKLSPRIPDIIIWVWSPNHHSIIKRCCSMSPVRIYLWQISDHSGSCSILLDILCAQFRRYHNKLFVFLTLYVISIPSLANIVAVVWVCMFLTNDRFLEINNVILNMPTPNTKITTNISMRVNARFCFDDFVIRTRFVSIYEYWE